MKKAKIKSIIHKRYVVCTTDFNHSYPVADNHLNRAFSPAMPGKAWVSDLTAPAARIHSHPAELDIFDNHYGFV